MYRVLIADDEMIERTVLYQTLHENLKEECAIYQAENGREALRIYEEEQIEIAILDIEMPGINGIGAAEKIREKDKDCCIIFLTAFDEFSYAKKAITVRALDYLLKPYDEQELMLVMEEAMRLAGEKRKKEEKLAELIEDAHKETQTGAAAGIETAAGIEAMGSKTPAAGKAAAGTETAEKKMAAEPPAPKAARGVSASEPDGAWESGNLRLSKVMELIMRYVREHYMYDISMQDLARAMNYSEAYFCKLFKQCFDQNFTSYLTGYRVNEAKKLLEKPTVNVKDIGKAVGYPDSNYFAKVFKRITGFSPTDYRLNIFQKE